MNATKVVTVEELLVRLEEEYMEYENEWLQMTPRDLINRSGDIQSIKSGKDYIVYVAEDGNANLRAYERTEKILADFQTFHMDSMDGAITEETIREYENYLMEDY